LKKNTTLPTKYQSTAAYYKAFASWLFSRPFGCFFLYTWDTLAGHSWPSLACEV